MVKNKFKGLDEFLQEAENIYGEMYKIGEKHPFEFLKNIFDVTKQKLSTRHNRKDIENAIAKFGMVPIVQVKHDRQVNINNGFKPKAKLPNTLKNIIKKPTPSPSPNDDEEKVDNKGATPAAPDVQKQASAPPKPTKNIQEVIKQYENHADEFLKKYKFN